MQHIDIVVSSNTFMLQSFYPTLILHALLQVVGEAGDAEQELVPRGIFHCTKCEQSASSISNVLIYQQWHRYAKLVPKRTSICLFLCILHGTYLECACAVGDVALST